MSVEKKGFVAGVEMSLEGEVVAGVTSSLEGEVIAGERLSW